ncbi:hypothetical protein HS5_02360 [Acidianus sp. HS-5]|nr:hypothetical protein HS5_02360 [Acidianus sp. HS-5]
MPIMHCCTHKNLIEYTEYPHVFKAESKTPPPPDVCYTIYNVSLEPNYMIVVCASFSNPYTLIIFTPCQFEAWSHCEQTTAVCVKNITSGKYDFILSPGNYILVINGYCSLVSIFSEVYVYIVPENAIPVIESEMSSPHNPTGIASYGIYNNSGQLSEYIIKTHEVLGFYNITSIEAYNSSFSNPYGASLQLNVVLQIVTSGGNETLWLQNVVSFITNEKEFYFVDNIWNLSAPCASINSTLVSGKGSVQPVCLLSPRDFYGYETCCSVYNFPFAGYLIINTTDVKGGVEVSFGYVIVQNGSLMPPNVVYYDKVFISIPDLTNSYILVDPNQLTGSLNVYDAELVFGGLYGGEITCYTSLHAELALMYNNSGVKPFPSVYTFGSDTAEATGDLHVSLQGNNAVVTVGERDYGLLTNNFKPSFPGFTYVKMERVVNNLGIINESSFYLNGYYYISPPLYFSPNSTVNYTLYKVMLSINGMNETILTSYNLSSFQYFNNITIICEYNENILVTIHYPNGTVTAWYLRGEQTDFPNIIQINSSVRYVLSQKQLIISSPINITPSYVEQYLISIYYPNGTVTEWYNASAKISLPSVIYINPSTRYVTNETYILITHAGNYYPNYTEEFLVTISYPNATVTSWYIRGEQTDFPRIIQVCNLTRYILDQKQLIITSPYNVTPTYVKQYLISIHYPNGTVTEWYNASAKISLPSVIYITSSTRYITNESSLMITHAGNYYPNYTEEFLVTIHYTNGTITEWLADGSNLCLYAKTDIFQTIKWVGTFNVNNGEKIEVTSPITETEVICVNYTVVLGIVAIAVIIGVIIFIIRRK